MRLEDLSYVRYRGKAPPQDVSFMPDTPRVVKRWGQAILAVLESTDDVRTVEAWSRRAGLSVRQLRSLCRLAGTTAKTSLDFARLLRAAVHQESSSWPLAFLLDVSDSRTLQRLQNRGQLDAPGRSAVG
jgi:hypothetical protein